uniref:HEAT repeat-containing protein 5A n=1 Tax=Sphaeramia orbicularis TaxID=375764 RepID=A0A673BWM9_9TELE
MERTQCLLLDEEAVRQLSDHQRAEFIFSWLSHLKKTLPTTDRVAIRQNQRHLVEQLSAVLIGSPGPPTRWLLAHCLALLLRLGDPLPASLLVERCNDIIRSKDDSPSGLPTRLAAVACLGSLYQQLGRMLIASFKDTFSNLMKAMKNAESQGRYEIMLCLEKILCGLGVGAISCHRDVYKAARTCLTDRSMAVRCAAAKCLLELQREAVFLWTSELDNVASLCFRAFEGSSSSVRVSVSELLGTLLAAAVEPPPQRLAPRQGGRGRTSLEEVMDLLLGGFLRGGAGFLRASGDMLKGTSSVSKDIRMGVTQACVVFVSSLGASWLESNFSSFLSLLMELASHGKATQTASDAVVTRHCVSFILRSTLGSLLGEKAQTNAAKQLCVYVAAHKRTIDAALSDGNVESRGSCADVSSSQHVLVCCLMELGALVQGLGSTAGPLVTDASTGLLDSVVSVLLHPAYSARLAAAWCLRCIAMAMPSQCSLLLDRCTERLVALKSSPEAVSGYAAAVTALVAAVQQCPLGIPSTKGKVVLGLAEDLLRSAAQNSRISLQRTQAGWMLISSLITLGPAVVELHLPRLLLLCRCLRRGDYFTWQVTLEGRAGALCAMKNLLLHCRNLVTDDIIAVAHTIGPVLWPCLPSPWCRTCRGQDNLNQPCSELTLLPPLCHHDDLPPIGHALRDPAHHYIEEQVVGLSGSNLTLAGTLSTGIGGSGPCPNRVWVLSSRLVSVVLWVQRTCVPPALSLLSGALESSSPLLRCLAAEGLARLVQVVNDPAFTVSVSLLCFDRSVKTARDAASRSGLALALGALYRYVGGISSPQHLSTCPPGTRINFLSLSSRPGPSHSLSLVVDLSGGLYRVHAEPSFTLVLRLLLSTPVLLGSAGFCWVLLGSAGFCGSYVRLFVGDSAAVIRSSVLLGSAVMQGSPDCLVQSRAVSCLQQLHMFCPPHVDLSGLVPALCTHLSSSYLSLRGAVVACLRQLVQREALEVSQLAVTVVKELNRRDNTQLGRTHRHTRNAGPMMTSSATTGKLGHWLKLCKDVLSASTGGQGASQEQEEADPGRDDDSSVFRARSDGVVCRIIAQCESADPAHFDMTLAQERRLHESTDFLVLHLGDLVRMAFMAATDHSDQLRLAGLQTLLVVIRRFSDVPEPEFPGHVILEQYQANVRTVQMAPPAFSADAPPDVTSKACQVCSAWIASGVVSDIRDLRRVHQLLASSLVKVQSGRDGSVQLYNEAAATMETLSVLKAWAEVYIVAIQSSRQKQSSDRPSELSASPVTNNGSGVESGGAGLLKLVQSDLSTLSCLWLSALQDYALLTLTPEYAPQLPAAGGSFYTAETVNQSRGHYASSWAPILHATALWLHSTGQRVCDDRRHPRISVEFLCSPRSGDQMENITSCLRALQALLDVPWPRARIGHDQALSVELLGVLHRLMVTREAESVQLAVLDLLRQIVTAAQEHVREKRHSAEVDDGAAEKETLPEFGEGRDTGGLIPGRSLVFAALELCLCVLVRKLPQLSPKLAGTSPTGPGGSVWTLSDSDCRLVSSALCVLSELPSVCSPEGQTVLILMTWGGASLVVQSALQALKTVLTSPMSQQEKSRGAWNLLLRSALNTLTLWDAGDPGVAVDQVSLLTALTIFLLSTGQTSAPSTLCTRSVCSDSPPVVSRCFQLLATVFQAPPPVSVPYIQSLGPPLVRFLQRVEGRRPQSPDELTGVLDGIRAMEVLVQAADESQRPQLITVLLPLLISFLLDENALGSAPAASRSLHEAALKDLMRLGPQHSAVFRSLVSSSPHLKSRLEAAVKGNQESLNAKSGPAHPSSRQGAAKVSPSITLKTNFL